MTPANSPSNKGENQRGGEKIKMKMNIINELIKHLGADKVTVDADILDKYSMDETSDLKGSADILVRAESAQDVSAVLKICGKFKIPVIPRGAGTGVTGGAVPMSGGVVLSLEKLDKIIEIDSANMVAVVEPGVITSEIDKAVKQYGLYYPPDPASLDICSIGGNVAENAGGARAVKYGTTKDYILGLEFVLPDGTIIQSGGKNIKNVTGYNIAGLLCASEGTLAVITKIFLRLIPAPAVVKDILIPFDTIDEAVNSVTKILSSNIMPVALEFMEKDAIELASKYLEKKFPYPEAGAHLLIQIDGPTDESVVSVMEKIVSCINADMDKISAAESDIQREIIWKARRSMRKAIESESTVFLAEDSVVPRSEIPAFLKEIKTKLIEWNLRSVMFGHAGDGNVHIDVLKGSMNNDEWKKIVPHIKGMIYKTAVSLGGTITGEHGIGFTRKDYLGIALTDGEIELMKRIKKAFDPDNILNPGKIFL